MKILFLGDIVGRPGIEALRLLLPSLKSRFNPDLIIANGENAAKNGRGLDERDYHDILSSGVDIVTLGNHYRSNKELDEFIEDADCLVRPLNVKEFEKGNPCLEIEVEGVPVRIVNVLGEAFMKEEVNPPIGTLFSLLNESDPMITIVDYHAESTSEKKIFALCFDGKVSACIGTHTHVQTSDSQILEQGCAFITDCGMCGDPDGVLGFDSESVINKIVHGEGFFRVGKNTRHMVNGVFIEIDDFTKKATKIVSVKEIR